MKRLWLLLLFAVLLVGGASVQGAGAQTAPSSQRLEGETFTCIPTSICALSEDVALSSEPPQQLLREDFNGTSLDATKWKAMDNQLGNGHLYPGNVSVANGKLYLKAPKGTHDGASIRSVDKVHYGSYTFRMKAAPLSETYSTPFMWIDPNFKSEVDIEIHSDGTDRAWFNTYSSLDPRYNCPADPDADPPVVPPCDTVVTLEKVLPFNPSAAFHDYRFDYTSAGVKFYVDGIYQGELIQYPPPDPMYLFVSLWWPGKYTDPATLSQDIYTEVEYIEVLSIPGA